MNNSIYYWNEESKQEFTLEEIRARHSNVSAPEGADLSFIGYFKVQETPLPVFNPDEQTLIRDCKLTESGYVRVWNVFPLPFEAVQQKKLEKEQHIRESIVNKVQERLDSFAKANGYDGILSACTYADSVIPKFADEGTRCKVLRDTTWAKAYSLLQEVLEGKRKIPESFDEIESELPALTWENTNG